MFNYLIQSVQQQVDYYLYNKLMNPPSMPYQDDNSQLPSLTSIECRICLQPLSCLIVGSYCNCRGTLKNVHESCFVQWLKKSKIVRESNNYYGICELCRDRILLTVQKKIKLRSIDKICSETCFHVSRLVCVQSVFAFILVGLIFITEIILMVVFFMNQSLKRSKITLVLLAVNGIFAVIGFTYLLFSYVLQIRVEITGIKKLKVDDKMVTQQNISNE